MDVKSTMPFISLRLFSKQHKILKSIVEKCKGMIQHNLTKNKGKKSSKLIFRWKKVSPNIQFYQQKGVRKLPSARWTNKKSSFPDSAPSHIIFPHFLNLTWIQFFINTFLLLAPFNLIFYDFSKIYLGKFWSETLFDIIEYVAMVIMLSSPSTTEKIWKNKYLWIFFILEM